MTARLLMIGVDGADAQRLDRWSRDGTLPSLAALRRAGATRRLAAAPGATDDSLWASFQYAVGEGEHGRWHHRIRRADGSVVSANTVEREREAFWHDLGRKGFRTAILDVPKCPPPTPLNGIHLADWLVHGRYFPQPRSFPDTLADDIVARFGRAPPSRCDYFEPDFDDDEVAAIMRNLEASIAMKRAAALHHLASEPWDLFVVGFKEAHCGGHAFWHLEDPRHERFEAARRERLGRPVRRLFVALDAAIGDLIAVAGAEAQVVVFTTTGMEPNGSLQHLWPSIVERLNDALHVQCEVMPHSDNCGALRLSGPDEPRERNLALAAIGRALRELRDARTHESVIASIGRPAVENVGSRAGSLPDLVALYRGGLIPDAVVSHRLGHIEAQSAPRRPGNHAGDGFAVLRLGGRLRPDLVGAMQDLGPLAARVLGDSGSSPHRC